MLKEKLDGNSDKLSQEILRLEQNIVELNDKHLHQIITRENIDSVFSISNTNEIGITTNFNDIKGSEYFDLLKYIIRNGYAIYPAGGGGAGARAGLADLSADL